MGLGTTFWCMCQITTYYFDKIFEDWHLTNNLERQYVGTYAKNIPFHIAFDSIVAFYILIAFFNYVASLVMHSFDKSNNLNILSLGEKKIEIKIV